MATAPSAFPRFRLLPPELQDIIWEHAISAFSPRIIELRGPHNDLVRMFPAPTRKFEYTSSSSIANVLHVCQRARIRAIRRWKLSFRGNSSFISGDDGRLLKDSKKKEEAKTRFDAERDVLLFMETWSDAERRVLFSMERVWIIGQGLICRPF